MRIRLTENVRQCFVFGKNQGRLTKRISDIVKVKNYSGCAVLFDMIRTKPAIDFSLIAVNALNANLCSNVTNGTYINITLDIRRVNVNLLEEKESNEVKVQAHKQTIFIFGNAF